MRKKSNPYNNPGKNEWKKWSEVKNLTSAEKDSCSGKVEQNLLKIFEQNIWGKNRYKKYKTKTKEK